MEELFRDSSHLLYVLAFTAMKNFHYNRSREITLCRNTYKFPQELSDSQVPHLFLGEQHVNPQAHRDRKIQILKYKVEYLVINFLISSKHSHKQII